MGKPGADEMDEDGVLDLLQREVDLPLFPALLLDRCSWFLRSLRPSMPR